MRSCLVAACLLFAVNAGAQPLPIDRLTPALPEGSARTVAAWTSWGTVIAALALETRDAWRDDNRGHALLVEGVRLGAVWGGSTAVKAAVHRARPCAPDRCGIDNPYRSFFSLHSAFACSGSPSLGAGTAALRVLANKHWLTDVAAGCGAGWAAQRWIR